jgi:hemerythrin-like domain-containing protein
MDYLVKAIRTLGKTVDPRVLHAMIYYLDAFSERMHHPKEDRYLFRAIRERSAEGESLIAELEEEHAHGEQSLRELAQAAIRYEQGGKPEFPAFEREVENFTRNYRDHMRREEDVLFPLAHNVLTAGDWSRLDVELSRDRDPLAMGADPEDFERLFNRILEIAPAPVGLGCPVRPR